MSKLADYIEEVKEYIKQNPDMSELEIIRYVYLDLGKRFSFNLDFLFGKSSQKKQIYRDSRELEFLDKSMETSTIICRSMAYIVEHILKELGTKVITVTDPEDDKSCPHVYNVVSLKDGRVFKMDLQNDLQNIQSRSFTTYFGLSTGFNPKETVIPRFELEQIDRKNGYIDDEHYYADDYLYLLKSDIGYFDNLPDKVKFVLENIDIHENKDMGYFERKRHHETMLRDLFTYKELLEIHLIDCYHSNGEKKEYKNCIAVDKKGGVDIYCYSPDENKYKAVTLEEFLQIADSGLVTPGQCPKLNQIIRDFKRNEDGR